MKRIYIDIDSLLDTRLGLLNSIDPEATKKVVSSTQYWYRNHTNWDVITNGRVSNEVFEKHWKERTAAILPHSMMTNILGPLKSITVLNEINIMDGISTDEFTLTVNIWPYRLGVDVLDSLTEALHHYLFGDIPITFVEHDMNNYTPQMLVKDYDHAFLFDFHWWVKKHAFDLAKVRSHDFTLVIPRLLEKDPSDLTQEEIKSELVQFQLMLRYYINIEFIDVACFSMVKPTLPKKEKNA